MPEFAIFLACVVGAGCFIAILILEARRKTPREEKKQRQKYGTSADLMAPMNLATDFDHGSAKKPDQKPEHLK